MPMKPEQLKAAGNKAFAAGNIQAALGAYSFALETLEKQQKAAADAGFDVAGAENKDGEATAAASAARLRATILSNRSLCLGKVGEHAEALSDSEAAIMSDETFAKAWVRKASALLALKRYADAEEAADHALAMSADLAKSVAQIKKKCKKLAVPTRKVGKNAEKDASSATTATRKKVSQGLAKAAEEDVHSFAKRLVTAALNCGVCDASKSKFEGSHLHLCLLGSGEEKRLNVPDLFEKYSAIPDAQGRARFLMGTIRSELVGHAVLPPTFDIAKHLLRPRLFSRAKIDGAGGGAGMPEGDALPCWLIGQGGAGCTTASKITDHEEVAVAVVVDYGDGGGMLPVLSSTCKAWGVDFATEVRTHAISNLRAQCLNAKLPEWKPHMSGCLTSPWTDNLDGVRLALFPEDFVPAIPPMEGAPLRPASAGPASVVCIFGTNNCVLASDPCNPISLCFAADIAINDMSKTGDFVSAVPYRLVRQLRGGHRAAEQRWAWRRYYPNLSQAEFSVPSAQVEIDQILGAVQSGGKKQIPVFGETESTQQGRKRDIVALLDAAKSGVVGKGAKVVQGRKETNGKVAPEEGRTKLKSGFLDGNALKETRTSEAEKRRKAAAKAAADVDFSTMRKGFFAGEKKEDMECDAFQEAGELVVPAETFEGAKKGLVFKSGPSGTGYYKDDLEARTGKAKTKSVSNEKLKKSIFKSALEEESTPAMIDLATLNSAIGSYGGGRFSGLSSGGSGMKSLFSL